jgi:hypothetical protein
LKNWNPCKQSLTLAARMTGVALHEADWMRLGSW